MYTNNLLFKTVSSKKVIPVLLTVYFSLVFLFAFCYDLIIPFFTQTESLIFNIESFSGTEITFIDAFYFSSVTQTTVGFGDIIPASHAARIVASVQAFVGYFSIIIFTTTFVSKIVIRKIIQNNMNISLPVDYSHN